MPIEELGPGVLVLGLLILQCVTLSQSLYPFGSQPSDQTRGLEQT